LFSTSATAGESRPRHKRPQLDIPPIATKVFCGCIFARGAKFPRGKAARTADAKGYLLTTMRLRFNRVGEFPESQRAEGKGHEINYFRLNIKSIRNAAWQDDDGS
jgi:hypothetical protein